MAALAAQAFTGDLNTRTRAWLVAGGVGGGATAGLDTATMWRQMLTAEGFLVGDNVTRWGAYLTAQGFSGGLASKDKQFWEGGGVL